MIDVIQLARKATEGRHAVNDLDAHSLRFDELEAFAALVLEAAAVECDRQAQEPECPERAQYCAEAIRAMKPGKQT